MKKSLNSFTLLAAILTLIAGIPVLASELEKSAEQSPEKSVAEKPAAADENLTNLSVQKKSENAKNRRVEVVFVLDSTGSMGGLIEGAKQKIWDIANEIILQEPRPDVRMGLLTYRDRKDQYVTKMYDLTSDIDAIYGNLILIRADGGGDTPESVNQALTEAVNKMTWTPKTENVYRVIFLVGDAPPHMDYQDDVKYSETCKKALENNIIINTIQCGNIKECEPFWRDIAKLSEGTFAQIAHSGGVIVVPTPYDGEIATLTRELNKTVVPYGSLHQKESVQKKLEIVESMDLGVNASRAKFNAMQSAAIQGVGDLVADTAKDAKILEKTDMLPETLQKMSLEERQDWVGTQLQQRKDINEKILELSKKRTQWLATEGKAVKKRMSHLKSEKMIGYEKSDTTKPALSEAPSAIASEEITDSFDEHVSKTIQSQLEKSSKK